MQGCQPKEAFLIPKSNLKDQEAIKGIELRLDKIEKEIKKHHQQARKNDLKTPSGPIRSLTFRIGTRDDRLRIYWADGSNSDLPCMKEQTLWVCG